MLYIMAIILLINAVTLNCSESFDPSEPQEFYENPDREPGWCWVRTGFIMSVAAVIGMVFYEVLCGDNRPAIVSWSDYFDRLFKQNENIV